MSQKPWLIKAFKVAPIQLFAAIQTCKLSKQQTTRYSSILQLLNRLRHLAVIQFRQFRLKLSVESCDT